MELVLPTSSIHILTKTKLTTKKTNLFCYFVANIMKIFVLPNYLLEINQEKSYN